MKNPRNPYGGKTYKPYEATFHSNNWKWRERGANGWTSFGASDYALPKIKEMDVGQTIYMTSPGHDINESFTRIEWDPSRS